MLVQLGLVFGWCGCIVAALDSPHVQVAQGKLRGNYGISSQGRRYSSFQGVPYAAPPVGKRRFQAPSAALPWDGVLEATRTGPPCLQYMNTDQMEPVLGAEDCLFLNVYTPQLEGSGPLRDVIVFVHGGAFMYGGGHIPQPMHLMDSDVVLVTLNYRLGLLGFLSTGDSVVPGNNGLKDQTAALVWVRDNIAAFGGNPESVTIAGLSAGGASVHYHFLSPLSRGLFHRGISLSGSALCQWAQADALPEKTHKLATLMNCPLTSSKDLVQCLREVPGKELVGLTKYFQHWRYNPFSPWAPTVEPAAPTAFIAQKPEAILRARKDVTSVPWLVGVTSEEGLYPAAEFIANGNILNSLDDRWDDILPHLLDYNYTVHSEEVQSVSKRIRDFYLGGKKLSQNGQEQLIQMIGDRHFVVEAERAARLQARSVRAPVFFYRFSYRGKHSFSELMSNTDNDYGACHGDDLAYILLSPFRNSNETVDDRAMSDLLIKVWTSFASSGSPQVGDMDVSWSPVSPESDLLEYLHIGRDTNVVMSTSADLGRRHFWDSLPFNAHHRVDGRFFDEF